MPNEAMFGQKPHLGVAASNLPEEVIERLETEEQLAEALGMKGSELHGDEETSVVLDGEESEKENNAAGGCQVQLACVTCGESCTGSDMCNDCGLACHAIAPCAFSGDQEEGDKGNGGSLLCSLCHRKRVIHVEQLGAKRKQLQQADMMTKRSVKRFKLAHIGDTVMVPAPPLVDRGRAEMPNVKAVVVSVHGDGLYKLGTKHGLLNQLYTRNQFSPCVEQFMTIAEVIQGEDISLREVAHLDSIGTGQGFAKCSCTKTCNSGRCKCFQNAVKCNSRCRCSSKCHNKFD